MELSNEITDDLRPYRDDEIPAAMQRIVESPYFINLAAYLRPNQPCEQMAEELLNIKTIDEFQDKIMHRSIQTVAEKTTDGLSCNGWQHLSATDRYLFISNHRDILLDAAFLQLILHEHQLPTSEISFGSNLMQGQFVIDIGKSNKMYKVIRNANMREFYYNSQNLSQYIRQTLLQKRESVWIAQRNGRTKNGDDMTDQGLTKMLGMSGSDDMVKNFSELKIVPIAISYQYETCDDLKVRELYLSSKAKYLKAPGEDLNSILTGVMAQKGKVHIEITPPISVTELQEIGSFDRNEFCTRLGRLIDRRILKAYHLFDTNYIAHDMLYHTFDYENQYDEMHYRAFANRMHDRLSYMDGDEIELSNLFLKIYANPVRNKLMPL